jgi:hypothetical protein
VDEGAEDEGRNGRERERQALQHHLAGDSDEAGVEGEGEGHRPCTCDL